MVKDFIDHFGYWLQGCTTLPVEKLSLISKFYRLVQLGPTKIIKSNCQTHFRAIQKLKNVIEDINHVPLEH